MPTKEPDIRRIAEIEELGRQAAIKEEKVGNYSDMLRTPVERSAFAQGYYRGLQETNRIVERKDKKK